MTTTGILKVNKNGKHKYYYVQGNAFPQAFKPEIRKALKSEPKDPDDLVKHMIYKWEDDDGFEYERISEFPEKDAEKDLLNYTSGTDRLYDVDLDKKHVDYTPITYISDCKRGYEFVKPYFKDGKYVKGFCRKIHNKKII